MFLPFFFNKTKVIKQTCISVDYTFIGFGAANCLLLKKLIECDSLNGKSIAIIEPRSKNKNDRTFCFWSTTAEIEALRLDKLISTSWKKVNINESKAETIEPFVYAHIKGLDLYTETQRLLTTINSSYYTELFQGEPVVYSDHIELTLSDVILKTKFVFDSRPPLFSKPANNQSLLYQSFYGWEIETTDYSFDQETATLMDFNIPQNDTCQFIYILPFTENHALVEVTRFGNEPISEEESNQLLNAYLENNTIDYTICATEHGVIPMASTPLQNEDLGPLWIKTGARANMIKPSTGYAFLAMAHDAEMIAQNLEKKVPIKRKSTRKRFKLYDRLLLKILDKKGTKGAEIFSTLFEKIPSAKVLLFMSEKTHVGQELLIFSKLPILTFLSAFMKDVAARFAQLSPALFALIFTISALFLSNIGAANLSFNILIIGFFSIGMAHGSLDHLLKAQPFHQGFWNYFKFISIFLLKSIAFASCWMISSNFGLIVFLIYSAWHFGETDFYQWRLKNKFASLIWGVNILAIILFFHVQETKSIITQISATFVINNSLFSSETTIAIVQLGIVALSLFNLLLTRSKFMLITVCYLFLSSMLPLLISFGTYFVFQHSLHGWSHLKTELITSNKRLWINALPFTLAGSGIILFFVFFNKTSLLGTFFILLSCLSLPHVLSMKKFYSMH